jgi:hypothetical protein
VELVEGRLFVELAKAMHDWLWCSDRIGNKPKLGLGCLSMLWKERRVGWRILVVRRSPLHFVIHFPG